MEKHIIQKLIKEALSFRENSYSPYSNYKVGAAILCEDGNIYGGANIENASYGATICAERSAAVKACSNGVRSFKAIAVVGGSSESEKLDYAYPCGICRQFLNEFCNKDSKVIVAKSVDDYKIYDFNEILPDAFGPNNLK